MENNFQSESLRNCVKLMTVVVMKMMMWSRNHLLYPRSLKRLEVVEDLGKLNRIAAYKCDIGRIMQRCRLAELIV